MRTEKKSRTAYMAAAVAAALAVFGGIWLPGAILRQGSAGGFGKVLAAPPGYYNAAGFAIARNTSAQLDAYDRLRLVSGSWESVIVGASAYEMSLRMHQAADAARKAVEGLYERGLYPCSLSSGYGNWYGWDAAPCKAVDSVFNTYTAYYWKIVFQRYDGGERHTVYVLEDGTFIGAEAYFPDGDFADGIADAYSVFGAKDAFAGAARRQDTEGLDPREWAGPSDFDVSAMEWRSLILITADEDKSRYVIQLQSDDRYVFWVRA